METKNHISLFENNIKNNELMLKRIDNEIQIIKDKNIERENSIEKQKAEIEEKNKDAEEMLTAFDSMRGTGRNCKAERYSFKRNRQSAGRYYRKAEFDCDKACTNKRC